MTDATLGRFDAWLVERYAAGALPSVVAGAVARRVARDEAWAAHYHALRTVERALDDAAALSGRQLDALTAAVLAAPRAPEKQPLLGGRWLTLAGAAACAVVVVVAVAQRPSRPHDELRARGGAAHAGVHVRCVDAARTRVLAEADVAPGAKLACPRAGLLAFSATNTTGAPLYVTGAAFAGAGDGGPALFTLPFAGEPPFAVPAGSVDVAMPRGFPLAEAPAGVTRFHVGAGLVDGPVEASAAGTPDGAGSVDVEVTP